MVVAVVRALVQERWVSHDELLELQQKLGRTIVFARTKRGADRVAQNASQSFDISVWQAVAALLVGGTVEIYDDEQEALDALAEEYETDQPPPD